MSPVAIALLLALGYPIFSELMSLAFLFGSWIVVLAYLIIGLLLIFAGFSGKNSKNAFLLVGSVMFGLAIATIIGAAISYIEGYILAL